MMTPSDLDAPMDTAFSEVPDGMKPAEAARILDTLKELTGLVEEQALQIQSLAGSDSDDGFEVIFAGLLDPRHPRIAAAAALRKEIGK